MIKERLRDNSFVFFFFNTKNKIKSYDENVGETYNVVRETYNIYDK